MALNIFLLLHTIFLMTLWLNFREIGKANEGELERVWEREDPHTFLSILSVGDTVQRSCLRWLPLVLVRWLSTYFPLCSEPSQIQHKLSEKARDWTDVTHSLVSNHRVSDLSLSLCRSTDLLSSPLPFPPPCPTLQARITFLWGWRAIKRRVDVNASRIMGAWWAVLQLLRWVGTCYTCRFASPFLALCCLAGRGHSHGHRSAA